MQSRCLSESFYCRARRRVMVLERCLNDYLTANAFEKKRSVCYRCPQGKSNRESFAGAYAHVDEELVSTGP